MYQRTWVTGLKKVGEFGILSWVQSGVCGLEGGIRCVGVLGELNGVVGALI